MLCLGIDPDLHDLSIAAWDDSGPVAAHVVSVPKTKGVTGTNAVMEMFLALTKIWNFNPGKPDAYAVEAQELNRVHRRPIDIVHLAQVAGMVGMRLAATYPGCPFYFPEPAVWKGSVPKAAMQARLYTELGWGYDLHGKGPGAYATPHQTPIVLERSMQWKHVGDALLLARWCWEQASGTAWKR